MSHSRLVQSVCRSLDIVEHVSQSAVGLSLSELSEAVKLKQPTVHNLLRTLVAKQILEKSSRPTRYRLGPGLVRLANAHRQHAFGRLSGTALQEMYDRVMEVLDPIKGPGEFVSVTIGQIIGGAPTMTLRILSDRPTVLERPYSFFHPYCSSVSLVFLAYSHWPQREQKTYWRRQPFEEFGTSCWSSMEHIEKYLATIRDQGYAAPSIYSSDTFRIAAPAETSDGSVPGVVGLGAWCKTTPSQRKKLIQCTLDAARQLSLISTDERDDASPILAR